MFTYNSIGGAKSPGVLPVDVRYSLFGLTTFNGVAGDNTGWSLAGGDINGDKIDDLIIGATGKTLGFGPVEGGLWGVYGHHITFPREMNLSDMNAHQGDSSPQLIIILTPLDFRIYDSWFYTDPETWLGRRNRRRQRRWCCGYCCLKHQRLAWRGRLLPDRQCIHYLWCAVALRPLRVRQHSLTLQFFSHSQLYVSCSLGFVASVALLDDSNGVQLTGSTAG